MPFRLLIVYVFVLSFVTQAFAQQANSYQFSRLDNTNGLSDNQVNCIYKDQKGFMWFGTSSGLNRYDGTRFKIFKRQTNDPNSLINNDIINITEGPDNKLWIFTHGGISIYDPTMERFSHNVTAELHNYGIPSDGISKLKKDSQGDFWFATSNEGLYRYHTKSGKTTSYANLRKLNKSQHSDQILDILGSQRDRLWLIYSDGFIEQLDTRTNKVLTRYDGIAKALYTKPRNFTMLMDKHKNLWICSDVGPIGVYCYKTQSAELVHYNRDTPEAKLNSNVITSIIETDDDKIWVGSDHGGINIIDPFANKITYLMNRPDDTKSLSGNSVYIYKDNTGIIWAGTFKQGINYYHKNIMQFPLFRQLSNSSGKLVLEDINSFEEDDKHNLWIGTNGGGLIYFDRKANSYSQFKHDPNNSNSISSDIVVRLYIDKRKRLWIGTYFGGLDCYDGKSFTHYRHNKLDPSSLSDDRVYAITEDFNNELWVGTFSGGLNILDSKTNRFRHPDISGVSDYTSVIYEDRQHNKWIGRDKGVDFLRKGTNRAKHYVSIINNPNSLIGNDVNTVVEDKKGLIWIGTKDGLSILNPKTDRFLNMEEGISLPANNVSNIVEDNAGVMWVSTINGLASISLTETSGKFNAKINNYNERDGLQGRAFNLYAGKRLESGEFIFGGINGFNLFNPKSLSLYHPKPSLLFTDLKLFNKSVAPGDSIDSKGVLPKALTETTELTLRHSQNVFDIEFAACDYFNPFKTKLEYKLEGFDKSWIAVGGNDRKATYTNLDGGTYIFKVRIKDSGPSAANEISMKITVLPPFLKSPFAYASYILILIGGLLYLRHRGIRKLKKEFEIEQVSLELQRQTAEAKSEALRMHQLDQMKIKFFTNVSHEFRTPLSLILLPIDSLVKTTTNPEQQAQLTTIRTNGKRLLNLVNQLLDFRKMEYNELKLNINEGDIVNFIKEVSVSFMDVAEQKKITFLVETEINSFIASFDHNKIERILFNLLSNAFKFTPAGGRICVMISFLQQSEKGNDGNIQIKVTDSGIGIAAENHAKVFDRFFQDNIPEALLNQGSGIGLSITKEFIRMHNGSIELESELGYGSCFTVILPIEKSIAKLPEILPEETTPILFTPLGKDKSAAASTKKTSILLIEDNEDLRFYLKENLKNNYHVIEAVNGKDGWQKALSMHPMLIISDISMPEMNGIELCKKIKADSRTAFIPVILLTAMTTEEDQLAGSLGGADDYILKPFNFEILLSKINNLLMMRQTLKNTYQKQIEVKAEDVHVVSEDDRFLKNAFEHIELNINQINFSVEELSKHLNLSRVSLYKKMLSLTGKTPVDCIRTVRLKRAVQLLERSQMSIASVSYEVGYNNPAYFSKVFKEEYGVLPSEYLSKYRKGIKEQSTLPN